MRFEVVPLVLASLLVAAPIQAQELLRNPETSRASSIGDFAARETWRLVESQTPPTRRSSGGGRALWWTGWAMAAGGWCDSRVVE